MIRIKIIHALIRHSNTSFLAGSVSMTIIWKRLCYFKSSVPPVAGSRVRASNDLNRVLFFAISLNVITRTGQVEMIHHTYIAITTQIRINAVTQHPFHYNLKDTFSTPIHYAIYLPSNLQSFKYTLSCYIFSYLFLYSFPYYFSKSIP